MEWATIALGLAVLGNLLWFSALLGWSLVTDPALFRTRANERLEGVGIAADERYHHIGWAGSIIALTGFIVYAVNTEVAANWLVWAWSLPLLLASSIWWAIWRKLVPKATILWSAIQSLQVTGGNEQMLGEAKATFADLTGLSRALAHVTLVLLLVQSTATIVLLG